MEEIIPVKNIPKFKDKLWCQLYLKGELKNFIQHYYIEENNTWEDTMNKLQITHRRLSIGITLIHIWEDDWMKDREKELNRIEKFIMKGGVVR